MRLALAMGRTLAELADSMSSAEFTEWLAYNRIFGLPDPWGEAGTIAAAVTRPYQKKGAKPAMPLDFIPADRKPARRRQSVREMKASMGAIGAVANARAKGPEHGR